MHAYTASGRFTVRGLDRKVEGVGKQDKSPRALLSMRALLPCCRSANRQAAVVFWSRSSRLECMRGRCKAEKPLGAYHQRREVLQDAELGFCWAGTEEKWTCPRRRARL